MSENVDPRSQPRNTLGYMAAHRLISWMTEHSEQILKVASDAIAAAEATAALGFEVNEHNITKFRRELGLRRVAPPGQGKRRSGGRPSSSISKEQFEALKGQSEEILTKVHILAECMDGVMQKHPELMNLRSRLRSTFHQH